MNKMMNYRCICCHWRFRPSRTKAHYNVRKIHSIGTDVLVQTGLFLLGICPTIQYNILLLQSQTDRCEGDIKVQ